MKTYFGQGQYFYGHFLMNLDFGQQKKAKERFFFWGGGGGEKGDFGSKLKNQPSPDYTF